MALVQSDIREEDRQNLERKVTSFYFERTQRVRHQIFVNVFLAFRSRMQWFFGFKVVLQFAVHVFVSTVSVSVGISCAARTADISVYFWGATKRLASVREN